SPSEPHLLGDAAGHLLLRDRHRDALAALCTAAAQHFATGARLLARTETMRALATLVVGLVRALHGEAGSILNVTWGVKEARSSRRLCSRFASVSGVQ